MTVEEIKPPQLRKHDFPRQGKEIDGCVEKVCRWCGLVRITKLGVPARQARAWRTRHGASYDGALVPPCIGVGEATE